MARACRRSAPRSLRLGFFTYGLEAPGAQAGEVRAGGGRTAAAITPELLAQYPWLADYQRTRKRARTVVEEKPGEAMEAPVEPEEEQGEGLPKGEDEQMDDI